MFYQLLIMLSFFPFNGKKGNLHVEVKGIKEISGDVQIGVYNKADGFTQKDKVYIGHIIAVRGTKVTLQIPNLPHGKYAITAFHDKNKNGKLDKSIFGVPTERYGFSNNARGTFGPPDFESASFEFNTNGQIVSLILE